MVGDETTNLELLAFILKPAVTCEAWHVVGFGSWCIVFYIAFHDFLALTVERL